MVTQAAAINPEDVSVTVDKKFHKQPDTIENCNKDKHIVKQKQMEINTPQLQRTENTQIDLKQDMTSGKVTHNEDNELGHATTIYRGKQNNVHTEGSRLVKSLTPTTVKQSYTELENDTETNVSGSETQQSLHNGSINVKEVTGEKNTDEHLSGTSTTRTHPDKNHSTVEQRDFDDNESHNITQQSNSTQRTLHEPNSNVNITDSSNVVNAVEYNTHSEDVHRVTNTPDQQVKSDQTTDSVNTKDSTITTEKTNVVEETPTATLKISDVNNEERDNEIEHKAKESETYIHDKDGTNTVITQNNYKEVAQDTLAHVNTLTVEHRPKSETGTPVKMTFQSSGLDEQHVKANEVNEKEVISQSPTKLTIDYYNEESSSNYEYKPITDQQDDGNQETSNDSQVDVLPNEKQTTEETQKNSNTKGNSNDAFNLPENSLKNGQGVANNVSKEPEGSQNDKQKSQNNTSNDKNNNGAILLLLPTVIDNGSTPSEFISSAMQSDTVKNMIEYISSNKISSNIMIAGPINKADPQNAFNNIKNNVKSQYTTLGIAEFSVETDVVTIYKGEGNV